MLTTVVVDVEAFTAQLQSYNKQGDQTVMRAVGMLEYASALRHLDELVNIATPEELAAIDELIRERPEFTVHTNLSKNLPNRPTTLQPVGGRGNNPQRGLPWMMALARIEVGAILATYNAHPDPFAVMQPTRLEFEAYRDILLDDAQAHFWSFVREPDLKRITELTPNREMLAYLRRLNVAMHLLHAAAQSRRGQLTDQQFAELVWQDNQLSQLRGVFRLRLSAFLGDRDKLIAALTKECCQILDSNPKELSPGAESGEENPANPAP